MKTMTSGIDWAARTTAGANLWITSSNYELKENP